jgi:DNA-binding IclR family transcriptional regulator
VLHAHEIDALKRFLFDYVEDLEKLAVLAWLSEQPTALGQGREAVAKATGLPQPSVREALGRLVERGLVLRSEAEPAAFSYAPQDTRVATLAQRVLDEYRANPLQVMELMTKNSIERVKSAAVQTFAESFPTALSKKRG